MAHGYSIIGLVVILILYAVIGLLAAAGSILTIPRLLGSRSEQIFYAMALIMVAGFYLAFTAYFGVATAWRIETPAVLVFVAISLLGVRLPVALIVGYALHGSWDLLHELHAHGSSAFAPGQLTAIPLAYGVFCAVFDFAMAAYFYKQRHSWSAERKATLP
jgi:hypothetical protein